MQDKFLKMFCKDVLELVDPSYTGVDIEFDHVNANLGVGMRMCPVCRQPLRDPVLDRALDCACTPRLARKRNSIYTKIAE